VGKRHNKNHRKKGLESIKMGERKKRLRFLVKQSKRARLRKLTGDGWDAQLTGRNSNRLNAWSNVGNWRRAQKPYQATNQTQ